MLGMKPSSVNRSLFTFSYQNAMPTARRIVPLICLLLPFCFLLEPVRQNARQLFFLLSLYDVASLKGYILSFGPLAPLISFTLMLFQSVIAPLPAFLITFANAALFGWVYGALLSWSSAMAGAALCFFLARVLGRSLTEKLASRLALTEVDTFFNRYGNYTILIARLLPFVSFDAVSYGAGLTSMRFRAFFWATGVGQLPATIIYSYAGEMLTGTRQALVYGLLLLFAAGVALILLKKTIGPKTLRNTEK